MRRARRLALLVLLASLVAGCSGVDGLDTTAPALTDAERADVASQVDKALAAGRYNVAWNQAVQGGAERARLEALAVRALAARSRHAAGMFDALRAEYGALEAGPRGDVAALVEEATRAGLWQRAVQIELITADDPPAYRAAWAIYRAATPVDAPALLEAIQAAKSAHAESSD